MRSLRSLAWVSHWVCLRSCGPAARDSSCMEGSNEGARGKAGGRVTVEGLFGRFHSRKRPEGVTSAGWQHDKNVPGVAFRNIAVSRCAVRTGDAPGRWRVPRYAAVIRRRRGRPWRLSTLRGTDQLLSSGPSVSFVECLSGGASRLAALLIPHICPICSLFAPCQPGAALRNPLYK